MATQKELMQQQSDMLGKVIDLVGGLAQRIERIENGGIESDGIVSDSTTAKTKATKASLAKQWNELAEKLSVTVGPYAKTKWRKEGGQWIDKGQTECFGIAVASANGDKSNEYDFAFSKLLIVKLAQCGALHVLADMVDEEAETIKLSGLPAKPESNRANHRIAQDGAKSF